MAKFLKKFSTHSEYETYIASEDKVLPNVSICDDTKDVHYNPFVETRVVAKFNVTSTSSPTQLCNNSAVSQFSRIEIDGVVQPSVVSAYTFSTTGEHTVKYTLTDPTSIGNGAFNACTGLTSIDIPDSVTSIGSSAFDSCFSLTSIDIPSGVTSIGGWAFSTCIGLTSIEIPSGVTSIGASTFNACRSLTSIDIPNSVTTIGDSAFYYCYSLTSCTIGDSVTSIGASTFSSCSSLTSIDIPNSVTSIGSGAFGGCSGLTSVTIGNGVTSIGNRAFYQCRGLTSIVCNATTAPTIQSSTFERVKTGGTLTVPIGSTSYDVWMGTGDYYLGKYGWTKVEQ